MFILIYFELLTFLLNDYNIYSYNLNRIFYREINRFFKYTVIRLKRRRKLNRRIIKAIRRSKKKEKRERNSKIKRGRIEKKRKRRRRI
jgi:hypothetical protein